MNEYNVQRTTFISVLMQDDQLFQNRQRDGTGQNQKTGERSTPGSQERNLLKAIVQEIKLAGIRRELKVF